MTPIPSTAHALFKALEDAMARAPIKVKNLKARVDKSGRTKLETISNPKRSVSQKIAARKRVKVVRRTP